MVDKKEDRKPITLYLDSRHQEWWKNLSNNSRTDMFNNLLDMYRAEESFKDTSDKQIANISSTKSHGPLSERCFVRFTKAHVKIVTKAAEKLKLTPTEYIRETVVRYSKQILGKDLSNIS